MKKILVIEDNAVVRNTVMRILQSAGYEVVIANSRGPETLTDLIDELGSNGPAWKPHVGQDAGNHRSKSFISLVSKTSSPGFEPQRGAIVVMADVKRISGRA